jgi:hypothetical protein
MNKGVGQKTKNPALWPGISFSLVSADAPLGGGFSSGTLPPSFISG